jgi:hypothetical protein
VRACHSCGYLVPETWEACKRCHVALMERIPVLAATVASPVAAPPARGEPAKLPPLPTRVAPPLPTAAPISGAYDPSFNAPASLIGPIGPGGYEPPAEFTSEPADAPLWAPLPATSTRRSPFVLVLIAALALALGFGGWKYLQTKLNAPPRAVQAFLDGGGVAYGPPGGGYTIRLPETPEVTSHDANGVHLDVAVIEKDQWEAGLAVITSAQPITDADAQWMMESAAASSNSAISGKVEGKQVTTHDGHPALDVTIDAPDGHPMHARLVTSGNRMYVVLAHSVHGTEAFFDELVSSFHITG